MHAVVGWAGSLRWSEFGWRAIYKSYLDTALRRGPMYVGFGNSLQANSLLSEILGKQRRLKKRKKVIRMQIKWMPMLVLSFLSFNASWKMRRNCEGLIHQPSPPVGRAL